MKAGSALGTSPQGDIWKTARMLLTASVLQAVTNTAESPEGGKAAAAEPVCL